jgi:hypothetical protein
MLHGVTFDAFASSGFGLRWSTESDRLAQFLDCISKKNWALDESTRLCQTFLRGAAKVEYDALNL